MESHESNIELAHKNTCDRLFKTPEFHHWRWQHEDNRDSLQDNNGILWIKGHPGVGKSTLMKHALIYCKELQIMEYIVSFYGFNARGSDELEKSPLGMLRSIVVQLLEQNSTLQRTVVQSCIRKKRRHGKCLWEYGELKDLILLDYKLHHTEKCIILIDALDECNLAEVEDVISFPETLSQNATDSRSHLKICLSSRHYPTIDMERKIELVVEKQDGHDEDIAEYVKHKLKTRDQEIQKGIIRKSQHIFIWVVLVIEILNREYLKGKVTAMRKNLDELPPDLDALFSKILAVEHDKNATVLLFLWVLFSTRTLSADEAYLAVLSGTDPDEIPGSSNEHDEATKLFIVNTSMGLVETINNNSDSQRVISYRPHEVQFIHQSVIDFLTRNQRLLKLDPSWSPSATGTSHHRLASGSLAYIKQTHPKEPMAVNRTKNNELYPFLYYACSQILEHAEQAQKQWICQLSPLRHFKSRPRDLQYVQFYLLSKLQNDVGFERFTLFQLLCWSG